MRSRGALVFALCAATLSACSILPAGSPTVRELSLTPEERRKLDVELFDVDEKVAAFLSQSRDQTLTDTFTRRAGAPAAVIGTGDVLQISVWEPGGSGLFGPPGVSTGVATPGGALQPGARQATLQPLIVEKDGFITVPFGGRVPVAGVTVEQARLRIEEKLRANAIQPQVMLTLAAQSSHTAVVGGEVTRAGIVQLSPRGDRVLDVIANAGGAKYPVYETVVRIRRKNDTADVSLKAILDDPAENIYVQRGDSIYLVREPRTFTAFGATGKSGHYPFDADQLLLTEAVAKAGGLVDNQADLSGVLLFRYETGRRLAKLDPKYENDDLNKIYPTVYKIDWRTARGILYARKIRLRDKDTVLIANAEATQGLKLLNLLKGVTTLVSDFKSTSSSSSK
jgi:polysaccharide biosynthesis/export protein